MKGKKISATFNSVDIHLFTGRVFGKRMFFLKENRNYTFHLIVAVGWLTFVIGLCGISYAQPDDENTAPVFTQPLQITTDSGHTRLNWSLSNIQLENSSIEFELQKSNSSSFESPIIIYKGPDTASFVSGLPNGIHYYRVRSIDSNQNTSAWSDPVEITVQHHSLQLAFALFAVGLIVFAATVFVVVKGSKQD